MPGGLGKRSREFFQHPFFVGGVQFSNDGPFFEDIQDFHKLLLLQNEFNQTAIPTFQLTRLGHPLSLSELKRPAQCLSQIL